MKAPSLSGLVSRLGANLAALKGRSSRRNGAHDPDDTPQIPAHAGDLSAHRKTEWQGPTYYGRPQLKPAPFENPVVGGYIFLAGLSGSATLLSALAGLAAGSDADGTVRRGRMLALLAPTVGSMLLVYDLHTPQRFYNMLRVAKRTSPMSIGTWILMSFSALVFPVAGAQLLADRFSWARWLEGPARLAQLPAALAGAGLSTYTASLLSATSTPVWAACPRLLAMRFASSSVATGASALSLGETVPALRRGLDAVSALALSVELGATIASHRAYERRGVGEAFRGSWGLVEKVGVTGLGVMLPLGLHLLSLAGQGRRAPGRSAGGGRLGRVASVAALAGSALFRVSIMAIGDESARRPEVSLRFSQPENLPDRREGEAVRRQQEKLRAA